MATSFTGVHHLFSLHRNGGCILDVKQLQHESVLKQGFNLPTQLSVFTSHQEYAVARLCLKIHLAHLIQSR